MNIKDIRFGENDLVIPGGPTVEEAAIFFRISTHSQYGLSAMYQLWTRSQFEFDAACKLLQNLGATDSAIANMREMITHIIPFSKKHGFQANPFTVKDAIAAMDDGSGNIPNTAENRELSVCLMNPKATQKDVREIRARHKSR